TSTTTPPTHSPTPNSERPDFVRRLRVGRACRLLTCTNMPIAKIQQLSGYTNASNFNRRFLEETGMTPSQYRREH
ncbi:helix-turn-helix domain-containing protein, partial [Bifidobacterium longum]|uniref:helix-turn-helix domain-containing protein n=1 Tax=Bifidobacterium longum TaxID=216816 RepID=UPI00398D3B14